MMFFTDIKTPLIRFDPKKFYSLGEDVFVSVKKFMFLERMLQLLFGLLSLFSLFRVAVLNYDRDSGIECVNDGFLREIRCWANVLALRR